MTLKEWLEQCGCFDVQPVKVKIGSDQWEGARYKRNDRDRIYVVGHRPDKKGKNWAYPFEGLDWYVAGYLDEATDKEKMEMYHPFGINFILMPWTASDPIDVYETYQRTNLSVEEI